MVNIIINIGSSSKNVKRIKIDDSIKNVKYIQMIPTRLRFPDKFDLKIQDGFLVVRRVDADKGWGAHHKCIICNTKIHVISYGNERFEKSKKRLLQEARSTGWFDTVTVYGTEDLDASFRKKYHDVLELNRGGGYWIWKSHIIEKMLDEISDDDILIYLDAGCTINKGGEKRFFEYVNMLENSEEGIISFELPFIEKRWTTNEIFDYFKANDKMKNSGQLFGGVRIMKKCPKLLKMINLEAKALHDDRWMFTDHYNKNQQSYFRENRHDQSIFSMIRKLHNPILIPDETSAPGDRFATKKVFEYPFWATRKRG